MTKEELEKEAREYLAEHSEYSEVFGQTFVAVDTLTAMVDFAEQETKELEKENAELKTNFKIAKDNEYEYQSLLTKAKKIIKTLLRLWNDVMTEETVKALIAEAEQFLKESE